MSATVASLRIAVALTAVAALALLSGGSTQAASFSPVFSASVSDSTPGQTSDLSLHLLIPAPDPNFDTIVTFIPAPFHIATDTDVPDGAIAGQLNAGSTLGLFDNPCNTSLPVTLDLLEATTDTSKPLPLYAGFQDNNQDGLPDNVTNYPDFLNRVAPGLQPIERLYGQGLVAGAEVYVNLVVFAPGTRLPRVPVLDPSLGYVTMAFLNDPTAPQRASAITSFCTPFSTDVVNFGVSKDNPSTPLDESGHQLRRNPHNAGAYNASTFIRSRWDSDADGIENRLDPCPYSADPGWDPRAYSAAADPDGNGIPSSCDTSDGTSPDVDRDGFQNRFDNCPLVANPDQRDTDGDGIGDACDRFPLDATDGGVAHREEACLASSIQIGAGGSAADPPVCPTGPDVPVPLALSVFPPDATLAVGRSNSLNASIFDPMTQIGVSAVTVNFQITGANPGSGNCVTSNSGGCQFSYTGTKPGQDSILATASANGQDLSRTDTANWVTPPANNDFANALVVDSLPFSATPQMAGSDNQPGEPTQCVPGATVWYKLTPQTHVFLRAETEVSGGTAIPAIYSGATLDSLRLLACANEGFGDSTPYPGVYDGPMHDSYSFAELDAGQTYYVQVGAFLLSSGLGQVHLDLVAASEGDTNCDGVTNGLDVLADLQTAAHVAVPSGSPVHCYAAGDYNCNLAPDAFDAIQILRRIVGLVVTMPVCTARP
jgi:hypothetical protein